MTALEQIARSLEHADLAKALADYWAASCGDPTVTTEQVQQIIEDLKARRGA